MKKLSLLLILVLLLSLFAGCGSGTQPMPEQTTAAGQQTQPEDAGSAAVTPMLFRVTDGDGHEMYLFGTIHVGDKRINAAADRVAPYLDGCGALAVEFDIVAYEKDYQAQMRDMAQFVYTDGTDVSDHMPPELFDRASALLKKAKLRPGLMKSYNLSMWSQLVEQAALITTSDLDFSGGMDRRLIQYCYDRKIEVRDVESPELQYGLMASFSDELNLLLIENTLDNLDTYGESVGELYELWTQGDYEKIRAYLEAENEEEEEGFTEAQIALLEDYNDRMLTRRNLGMRDRALEWLKAGDKVFFAVGAAHLVGEDGLVELLRAEGCTVEQVVWSD